ncbi:hypothetical protein V7S43_001114 [Phytophthora oleae]|uniref:TRAF-type domain-containing protein n=1 Tax=Phytophthora oleae TaxID=2107226 RepID=A0ABD3G5A9_9STRA
MAARRGAMPHHHVPAPKETSPVVDRLRLALIHMARRTMLEAVDKVWVTFEDELTRLTLPSVEPSVDDFEQFSNCCGRLARFIDNNMETTPGFLAQMDRLILACHSGATGPALHSVMTKELRIRRGSNKKNGKKHIEVETDTASISIDESPAISPLGDTYKREDETSDSEVEMAGTAGTQSRQWTTRKRLSTRTASQHRTKRVKRSLMTQWGNDAELLLQEEIKCGDEDPTRKENAKKERKKRSTQSVVKQVKASKRTSRQLKNARRPRNGSEAEQKKSRGRRSERAAKRGNFRKAETEWKLRWNLRSASKELASEGYQTRSKSKQEKKPFELEKDSSMAKNNDLTPEACEEEPHEKEMAKDGAHGVSRADGSDQQSGSLLGVDFAAADVAAIKTGRFSVAALEREIDMALANSGVYLVDNDEDVENNSIENTQKLCTDPKAVTVDERDDVENTSPAENDGLGGPSAERSMREVSPGVDHAVQVSQDDNGGVCAVSENDSDRETLPLSGAGTDAGDAKDLDNSAESQQPEAILFESDMLEADFLESDEESPVPGLCDAGMRTAQQVSHFKGCLRKSIHLVDAMLCRPPPGKICSRGCDKIRARQCSEGIPCRDQLCRNWHDAEAHTERCKNDLCEFKNRIVLRETMNQIANLNEETKSLESQWEEYLMEYTVATVDGTNKQYTPVQLQQLHDDIEQLFRRISSSKKEIESLENKQRVLLAYLSAIGITPQHADAADNFPDFETHYQ